MLSTHEPDPTKTAGTIEEYRQSETVRDITEALAQRYYRGGVKYGVFIDDAVVPTEITGETSFAEMAYNELQDGITYAYKALKVHEENEAMLADAAEALSSNAALIGRMKEQLSAQEQRVQELESQVEMLQKAREDALHEGDLSREREAELVHANVELLKQIEELKKEVSLHRGRATRLGNSARQYQQLATERLHKLDKVPTMVKRVYGIK